MDGRNPKVSVVIPIYNAEAFLHQTLFSVTKQTFRDIEIICVDDCSKDRSREILSLAASRDPRIINVFHEINKGEGAARQSGIRRANGEYIMFLDADDSFTPDACKTAYRAIKEQQVDILQFGTNVYATENISDAELSGVEQLLNPCQQTLAAAKQGDLADACFHKKLFGATMWNKIYRTELAKQAAEYYPEQRYDIGADVLQFFLIALFAKSYSGIEKKCYNYNFGCGITGGKALTWKQFANRVRCGDIVAYLEETMQVLDPYGNTQDALDRLYQDQLDGALWALLFEESSINKSEALDTILKYFKPEDVLGKLLWYYDSFNDIQRKAFLEMLGGVHAFQARKHTIKTIGVYYYRVANGGVERVLAMLANIWKEEGYRVVLFTDELPSTSDYSYPREIPRVVLPKIEDHTPENYRYRVAFWREMLERYEIDIMVNHAWVSETIEADILAVKSAGVPLVMHTHGLFSFGASSATAKWAYDTVAVARSYKLADAVITLTKADYTWWHVHHPCVFRTMNPLTFDMDKVTASQLNTNSLLYVGRIQQDKRVEDLLEILHLVLDSGCETTLHIVGKCEDPQYEKQLTEKIKKLKLESYVVMHGYQSNVGKFYEKASVLLIASAFEGFPMSFVEAMAYGVPIVTYDLPNVDFIHGVKGISVVGQRDVRAAADAVVRLLADQQLLEVSGRSVREHVKQMYAVAPGTRWKQIFQSIENGWQNPGEKMDTAIIKTTVGIFLDNYLSGVEAREKERLWLLHQYDALQARGCGSGVAGYSGEYPGDVVLKMYQDGAMGFNYIFRFTKAYIKFKVSKQNRLRKRKKVLFQ